MSLSILVYMTTASTKMVRLDADVVDWLKVTAARRKTTVQALVWMALLQWCSRQPEYWEAQKNE